MMGIMETTSVVYLIEVMERYWGVLLTGSVLQVCWRENEMCQNNANFYIAIDNKYNTNNIN